MEKTVLIADDATFMRMMIKDILIQAGFTVVGEAATGKKAVELYDKEKPTFVTMDITMPEMDGITAIKEILKIDPKARILVCSAMGQRELVVEALEAGALDFLIKPFKAESVIDALHNILRDT